MKEETRAMIEKGKEEIREKMAEVLENTHVIEIGSVKFWRVRFNTGEFYQRLLFFLEEEKNPNSIERLASFFRSNERKFERRVRDVSKFYVPFLIAMLILILGFLVIQGRMPSLGTFLVVFLLFAISMIVFLYHEVLSNHRATLFSLMHEYALLLLLEREEKRKTLIWDDLVKEFLKK